MLRQTPRIDGCGVRSGEGAFATSFCRPLAVTPATRSAITISVLAICSSSTAPTDGAAERKARTVSVSYHWLSEERGRVADPHSTLDDGETLPLLQPVLHDDNLRSAHRCLGSGSVLDDEEPRAV